MKMTKSWTVALLFAILSAVLPIINEPLQENFGIVITEGELEHFLTAFGITAAAGVANATRKQLKKTPDAYLVGKPNPEQKFDGGIYSNTAPPPAPPPAPETKHDTDGIKFGPVGAWYQTNFTRNDLKGNVLAYGQGYLWIKVPKARSYVTVQLKDDAGRIIQVDQSSKSDEDNNHTTTRLEMFSPNGSSMPRGKYSLRIQADAGSGDAQGIKNDAFEIV